MGKCANCGAESDAVVDTEDGELSLCDNCFLGEPPTEVATTQGAQFQYIKTYLELLDTKIQALDSKLDDLDAPVSPGLSWLGALVAVVIGGVIVRSCL